MAIKIKLNKYLKFAIKLVLSVAALAFVFSRIDMPGVLNLYSQLKVSWLLPAVILFVFSKTVSAIRLNHFFRCIDLVISEIYNLKLYLLGMFYKDPERWAFTFQLAAFTTRAKTWSEVLEMIDHSAVVLERSIYCDRYVFAKNCYQSGLMSESEWQIYCRMWDWLQSNWCADPDKIVYLRTPAEVCHERIDQRGRNEENKIPLEYLRDLEVLHDEWLLNNPLAVVVDGCKQWQAEEIHDVLVREGVALTAREETVATPTE